MHRLKKCPPPQNTRSQHKTFRLDQRYNQCLTMLLNFICMVKKANINRVSSENFIYFHPNVLKRSLPKHRQKKCPPPVFRDVAWP